MDCPRCNNDPCSCKRMTDSSMPSVYDAPKTGRPYYYLQCAIPGCTTMIAARVGSKIDPAICKWCQAGTSVYRQSGVSPNQASIGPTMTKEQFGLDLYESIRLQSLAVTSKNEARRHRNAGREAEAIQSEKSAHMATMALHQILDKGTIGAADVRRLLAIQ